MLRLGATVINVDEVAPVLEFYRSAFALETRLFDPGVQLEGRTPGLKYPFAELAVDGGTRIRAPALGALLMPGFARSPSGRPGDVEIDFICENVESAFDLAVRAGATPIRSPERMPWGQTVAYFRSIEGTFVGLCSPPPAMPSL